MSLTVSNGWLLSLPPSFSCCMSLAVSHCCWLLHTVSPSAMDLLHVSLCFQWCLAVSHHLSGYVELLHVFHCLFHFHRVAACPSPSLMVAGRLSLSSAMELLALSVSPVPWSCYMFLTVSYCCWLSLTFPPSSIELLNVSHCLIWLLAVSHCFSGPMELLHVFHCHL